MQINSEVFVLDRKMDVAFVQRIVIKESVYCYRSLLYSPQLSF